MRIVEILTGLAMIGSIATFLGIRAGIRRSLRKLKTMGRPPSDAEIQQAHDKREVCDWMVWDTASGNALDAARTKEEAEQSAAQIRALNPAHKDDIIVMGPLS